MEAHFRMQEQRKAEERRREEEVTCRKTLFKSFDHLEIALGVKV